MSPAHCSLTQALSLSGNLTLDSLKAEKLGFDVLKKWLFIRKPSGSLSPTNEIMSVDSRRPENWG
jgi:hypothetical protein